jgi:integrase
MDQGIDPREEKKRRAEQGATLKAVFEDYLANRTLKPTTLGNYKKFRDLYLKPWLNRPVSGITRADTLALHRQITADHGGAAANVSMVLFGGVWNYAHAHLEQPPISPTNILTATKTWNPMKRKTDRLAPAQFPKFAEALGFLRHPLRDAFNLVLHTGLRSEEAAGLLWENVDFDGKAFSIRDTKNGSDLTLPMSGPVKEMLERRLALHDGSPFVFKGQGRGGNVALLSRSLTGIGFEDLTVHGLRRTFRSLCESLAIPPATIKCLMNHSLQADITDSYLEVPVEQLRPWVEKISAEIARLVSAVPS